MRPHLMALQGLKYPTSVGEEGDLMRGQSRSGGESD